MEYEDVFKPSILKELAIKYGFKPTKQRGQNYLITRTYIDQMIAAADLNAQSTVIEVGPGFGVLSMALSEKVNKVVAFELEKTLSPYWEEVTEEYKNIEIIWGNALKTVPEFLKSYTGSYTVVASLPFQITSALIRMFLEAERQPESVVIIVQKEVADRMCAPAGKMSLLSLSVQLYGTPKIETKIPSGNFWPPPEVNSAIISIKNISNFKYEDTVFKLAKAGFSSRRKQLWRNLSRIVDLSPDDIKKTISDVSGGNPIIRAQSLSIKAWKELGEKFNEHLSTN